MVSVRGWLYQAWFRASGAKRDWIDTVKFDRSIRTSQRPGAGHPPESLRSRHRVDEHDVAGFPSFTVAPRTGGGSRHVLYLHGGAYVHPPHKEHWSFVGDLVTDLNCSVTLPLYPLAPRYRYDTTLEVVWQAYQRIAAVTEPADQVVMGDSAGGGLTLALAQRLRAESRRQPANLVLLSPWLDITLNDPAVATLDRRDPYLSIPGLLEAARLYAGTLDHTDPRLSPLFGELTGLGRLSVFTGSRDVLFIDARRLRAQAELQDVDLDYVEYEDMFHGWMLQQPLPEARRARRQIVHIIHQR
jgi:acetyl esterase/lipase